MPSTSPARCFDPATRAWLRERLVHLPRRVLGDAPRAAVLVPLCHVEGGAAVLFTKRSTDVGTHKGQVSFPGGRMDPDDVSETACALRELNEELGIEPSVVDVLGLGHDVYSLHGVRVTPVVGFIGEVGDLTSLRPSPREIAEVFTVPLAKLLDPAMSELQNLGGYLLPAFTAGPHPIWGLTGFMLDELLRATWGLATDPPSGHPNRVELISSAGRRPAGRPARG